MDSCLHRQRRSSARSWRYPWTRHWYNLICTELRKWEFIAENLPDYMWLTGGIRFVQQIPRWTIFKSIKILIVCFQIRRRQNPTSIPPDRPSCCQKCCMIHFQPFIDVQSVIFIGSWWNKSGCEVKPWNACMSLEVDRVIQLENTWK